MVTKVELHKFFCDQLILCNIVLEMCLSILNINQWETFSLLIKYISTAICSIVCFYERVILLETLQVMVFQMNFHL